VRIHAFEVGAESQLDDLELGELREDRVVAVLAGDALAVTRLDEDAVHARRLT
jgi:hypothetical protein